MNKCVLVLVLSLGLSSCIGTLWTGANTVYDRHHLYKKISDLNLVMQINKVLAVNRTFNIPECVIDIAVFNGDILLAGHVPTMDLFDELNLRLNRLTGYRRLYNEVIIKQAASSGIQDSWITAKIRSQIVADSSIDPNAFKIITSDRVVYLMGDVRPEQAEKVIKIARLTRGVVRVVKLFRYFTYQ
jgi:osmotically-inducible protein OsmY